MDRHAETQLKFNRHARQCKRCDINKFACDFDPKHLCGRGRMIWFALGKC